MTVDHMRLPSPVLSQPWRRTLLLVSYLFLKITCDRADNRLGLQTPRLKRLAEIVSAQAIAQQEKLDYPEDENALALEGED